ncbi:MAG: glycosyltransferase family 39 protein [Isosphaeraceae bacterium]
MSHFQRGARIGLLMLGASALLFWVTHHAEVSFADGLRDVKQARQITLGDLQGGLWQAVDHPLHPLSIAGIHQVLGGGDRPYAWQTAAQAASVIALVLAVIPLYMLGLELFDDDTTATLGVLLVISGRVACDVAVNVLSESTFLLFWAWGLWASARFLREGGFVWLVPAVLAGALAYLTRPEGVLLLLGLVATLLILPVHRGTRIDWPRWWAAVGVLVIGPALLVGPYVALKGGIATRPAVGRLIGVEPEAPPQALEREGPLPEGQTRLQTYAIASARVARAIKGAVTLPLLPCAAVGLFLVTRGAVRVRTRAWLLMGVVTLIAAAGLVRLHATGGYCTVRHALIPGTLLILTAAHGIATVLQSASIDGRRIGLGDGRLQAGPAVWVLVLALLTAWPLYRVKTPYASSFAPYRAAGLWLSGRPEADGRVLDLTDWSLFFSGRRGAGFAEVLDAAERPGTRFLVVREAHLSGHLHYNEVLRRLVAGKEPVARFPEQPEPHQLQVGVYDLAAPTLDRVANGTAGGARR